MKKLVFLCFAVMFLSLNAQNYCLDFDGVDDFIDVTSSTVVQGAFTVEAWVKPMHPTDNLNILSTRSGSDNSFDMKLMSGNKIHGDIGNGTTWLSNAADGDFEYATGTWYHIAYSVSLTGYEIFANGTSVGSGTWPSNTPLLMNATHQINIGRYNGGLEYFKGCIDEVRVWNVARTGQEIRDNMLKPLLGTETGLVAYYGFNEASGMTAGDNAGSNDGTLTNMAEEDWALSFCFNPQIKSLSPADNSLNVSLSENLEITFDKAILAGTGSIVIHKSSDDSIVETIPAISCAIVDSIVTIDPSSDFEYFTDYYVLIDNTAFMDNESAYFEGIAEKTVWNFNSKAVVYVIGTSPADNSQNVSLSENLEITFNKNIFAGSGNVVIHKSSDDSIVETIPANSCTIGRSKVTIDPSNDFEILTDFYVLIDSNAFMDSGSTYYNGITEKTVWNFTSQNYFTEINTSLTGVIYSSVEWGDYDNDGDLDILLTGNGISKIYRNDAGTFTDVAAELIGVSDCSSALGDYDNDGDLDILLTGNSIFGPISKIFRNNGGTFFDIAAVLTGVMHGSSAWGDYDNDGDLDILLTGDTNAGYISKIYRNDAGIFIDINAVLIGVVDGSSEWGDFDNDGYLDLIITGYTGSERISKIYRNNAGVFIDIGAGLPGVSLSSVAWGDYDNDSDLDLIISGTIGFGWFSRIYRNDSGMFANIGAGFTEVFNGSAEWGDYDNDGDLDILLTGYKAEGFSGGGVSRIYRNDSGMFIDISAGLTDVYKGSSAWGDYDNDGDLDILLTGSSGAGYIS
ncbi:MAG: FG-GAP-like repeat-containing protein, partial [Candidatus Delongbacteria bacterium]